MNETPSNNTEPESREKSADNIDQTPSDESLEDGVVEDLKRWGKAEIDFIDMTSEAIKKAHREGKISAEEAIAHALKLAGVN